MTDQPDFSTSWFKKPTLARKRLLSLKVGDSLLVDTLLEATGMAVIARKDRAGVSIRKMKDGSGWRVTRTK